MVDRGDCMVEVYTYCTVEGEMLLKNSKKVFI